MKTKKTWLPLALLLLSLASCERDRSWDIYYKVIQVSNTSGQNVTLTVKGVDYFVEDGGTVSFVSDEWAWFSPPYDWTNAQYLYKRSISWDMGSEDMTRIVYTADTVALRAADGTRAVHYRAKDSTFHPAAHNIVDTSSYLRYYMLDYSLFVFRYTISPYDLKAVE